MGANTTNYNIYKPDVGEQDWGAFVNAGFDTIDGQLKTVTDHITSDGSDHSLIDQSVISGATPTFTGTNFTGIPAGGVSVTNGSVIVGNGSNVGAAVSLNGDVTITNTGVATVAKVQNFTFDAPVAGDDGLVVYYNHASTKFDYKTVEGTNLTAAPAADTTVSGVTVSMTAGENVAFGNVCYMKSDGKLWKADADAAATMPAVAMAAATISADAAGSFLLYGFARQDSWTWTVGGAIYVSGTVGDLTQTAPVGSSDVVQIAGIATHADRMLFNPQLVTVELA